MNDEQLFELIGSHAGPADVDPGFDDRLYQLLQREMGRTARSARLALLLVAALLLGLVVGGAVLVGSAFLERSVLPDASASAEPSVLPAASPAAHLAYGLDGDIYLADGDGKNPVRIADGQGDAGDGTRQCGTFLGEGSMWSPDGRYLAYRSDNWGDQGDPPCPGTVHVNDAQGRPVASFPGTGWSLGWSRDSTRVATWVEMFQTIGIYGIDGARQALLTMPDGCADGGDYDPLWLPDGRSLLNAGCEVPVDGRTPRRLPDDDVRRQYASLRSEFYSPDLGRIAYFTAGLQSLVIADAGGAELRVLTVGPEYGLGDGAYYSDLIWSPSGDSVAFTWGLFDRSRSEDGPVLRMVDVSSGKVTTIATEPGIVPIDFSPDGERILFATHDGNFGGTGLWSVNVDGSDVRLLVAGTGWGDWQPPLASP
jgi:dipeptidyl aminopeptidase/acylaminoacyl peptidase